MRGDHMIRATGLTRSFGRGAASTTALSDASLFVAAGEFVVLRGPSGSGKTTLLTLAAGLDEPDAGEAWIGNVRVTGAGEADAARLRREVMGFVDQDFPLVPFLTAAENVELPLRLREAGVRERRSRVAEMIEALGLGDHAAQRPEELSGGQQQRVAVARALVHRPRVLIADEPTAQLDSGTAGSVISLVIEHVRRDGMAALVASHDAIVADRADRVVEIHDGRVRS